MKRSAVTAWLLCVAVSVCVFSPLLLSAQDSARVQTGPREYAEDHHDTSMSLVDMIRLYPQPNPRSEHWVRPDLPLPPREYPADVTDPVRQTSSFGPLAATVGLNFEGNDFDTVCNCAPPDTNGAVGTTQYVQLVNTVFTVYSKSTGAVIAGPTATNS